MPVKELYEKDFQVWIEQTIVALENRDFTHLDITHLVEELAELGRSERKAFTSNLLVLLAYLLKLRVQGEVPETMKGSWRASVAEHRQRVLFDRDCPFNVAEILDENFYGVKKDEINL